MTQLQSVTCHMGSHSVTCHPTQVNTPRLNPARQAGTRFTYPRWMECWVDLGDWLHTKMVYPPTHPSTNPAVHGRESNCWLQVRHPNHYTTKAPIYFRLYPPTHINCHPISTASKHQRQNKKQKNSALGWEQNEIALPLQIAFSFSVTVTNNLCILDVKHSHSIFNYTWLNIIV